MSNSSIGPSPQAEGGKKVQGCCDSVHLPNGGVAERRKMERVEEDDRHMTHNRKNNHLMGK